MKSGRIMLYDKNDEFIISQKYSLGKSKGKIICDWRRKPELKHIMDREHYIHISPNANEDMVDRNGMNIGCRKPP